LFHRSSSQAKAIRTGQDKKDKKRGGSVRFFRRSRLKSSRGHVRIEQGPPWMRWAMWGGAILTLVVVATIVITQIVLPRFEEEESPGDNRTWLEFAWTASPVNQSAIRQLGQRLEENAITRVYLETAAWRTDGSLLEGEHAAEFAKALRTAYPELKILLWVRMSGDEIKQADRRAAAVDLAGKAVRQWDFDGVQLNGRAVLDGSESYIQLVRDLRAAIGPDALLSLAVPPDRVPSDPDVPADPTVEPGLTWGVNYKQRVGLLGIDEIVVMAHASGLSDAALYEIWVAYQVEAYAAVMAELERPPDILIALPTYDEAPEHDPAVEEVRSAVRGVKDGIEQAGKNGKLVKGVGLYEYKTTDSLEWALYGEHWLGRKSD
jgi:hypothetical protein